jgi:DNA-binding NarL/FixJ family response regulator
MTLRILIADDEQLVRSGFRMILESEQDMEVVAEAPDGREAVAAARRLRPDVALIDLRMPVMDGIAATAEIVRANAIPTRVLVVTTFDTDEDVYAALHAGASGFLLKDSPPDDLASAVRVIAAGEALLAPSVTRRVIEEFVRASHDRRAHAALAELTERELDVLRLIAKGLSNAEIARELTIAKTTVKTHVAHVLMKLDVRDRAQAVVAAYESGVVALGAAATGAEAFPPTVATGDSLEGAASSPPSTRWIRRTRGNARFGRPL